MHRRDYLSTLGLAVLAPLSRSSANDDWEYDLLTTHRYDDGDWIAIYRAGYAGAYLDVYYDSDEDEYQLEGDEIEEMTLETQREMIEAVREICTK